MIEWGEYLIKGLVKEQRPDFDQIEQQIIRAEKDLKTFGLVLSSDPEWACTIAYQANASSGPWAYVFLRVSSIGWATAQNCC